MIRPNSHNVYISLSLMIYILNTLYISRADSNRYLATNKKFLLEAFNQNRENLDNHQLLRNRASRATQELTKLVSKRCMCGGVDETPTKQFRVVGGVEAKPHSRPWMVALVTRRNFQFCGGSLINNRFVLTAAHCVYRQSPKRVFVIVGLHDKFDSQQLQEGRRSISQILIHPNYDSITIDNDIALLQLSAAVIITDKVLPVCLPNQNDDFNSCSGTVTGWGATADNGPTSQTLQEVVLPIIPLEECKKKYPPGEITDNMMCAGFEQGARDSCQGDSGGSMVIKEDDRWYLIAVVSWGNGCARANQPGIYTNATKYINWIYSNTQDAVYCY